MKNQFLILMILNLLFIFGCSKKEAKINENESTESEVTDFVDSEATAEEKKFLEASRPFVTALAKQEYKEFYGYLSSHATKQMSLNQFHPESDEKKYQEHEENPIKDITVEKFVELIKTMENEFGLPMKVESLYVQSLDKNILNRKGTEEFSQLDSMLAIGAMPESIPADIRRASVRAKILVKLSESELAKIAKEQEISLDELKKDPDFQPYFNLKLVLVEDAGNLKIGYFEFLPPSMLD